MEHLFAKDIIRWIDTTTSQQVSEPDIQKCITTCKVKFYIFKPLLSEV